MLSRQLTAVALFVGSLCAQAAGQNFTPGRAPSFAPTRSLVAEPDMVLDHDPLMADPMWADEDGHPGVSVAPGGNAWQIPSPGDPWTFQVLPDGLIYKSYLAGVKESRIAGVWAHDKTVGDFNDVTLGGRVGIMRYGTPGRIFPEGVQIDIEGAAFPRLNLDNNTDLDSVDFRFGVPLTFGFGAYQMKIAGYHLSAHAGDEFLVRTNTLQRTNYSENVIVWGHSYYFTEDFRAYGEVGYAYYHDVAGSVQFQFGFDLAPSRPTGLRGAPFLAMNGFLREEVDYGGNFVAQTGWAWRGDRNAHLFRVGLHYFNGKTNQFEFFNRFEQQLGVGVWYDF